MKKLLFLAGALFLLVCCNQPNGEQEISNVQSGVKEFYSAMEKFDYEALRSCTTHDFSGFQDGFTYNFDEFSQVLKSFEGFVPKIDINFLKTEVYGNMAFVVVEFGATMSKGPVNINMKTNESYILKKTDNKWQMHYFHVTNLPDVNDKKFTSIHLMQISDSELLKQLNAVLEKANSMIMSMGYMDCGYKLLTTVSDKEPKYNYVLIASWKNQETYKAIHENGGLNKLWEESAAVFTAVFKNEVYVKASLP